MFSGIVQMIAEVERIIESHGCKKFTIKTPVYLNKLRIGDSLSINGVCVTVTSINFDLITFDLVPETLKRTNLGLIGENHHVNLEQSVRMDTRIGGHLVTGHIDCRGKVFLVESDNGVAKLVTIKIQKELTKYIIKKGFITVDGMSLTVIDVGDDYFTMTLIPHTQEATISNHYYVDSIVNIEIDQTAKYIEKLLGAKTHVQSH